MRYLSLFSGIESASVAWHPLGWECVGVAEIEPFPCAVLAHHYPNVPNLGSVTDITDAQIAALGPIDLVVGGSPCQDLSVAGKRAGLAGARSGLFHEQLRIFHAARTLCGARFLLWENVPGAFSSHNGRDFALVVGEMAGAEFGVPRGKWQNAGAAAGENGLVEWRALDAQYVRVESHPGAVPQRRRRVFALLDTGDWSSRPPILLEPESLRGDSPPRRGTGEGVAHSVAPCIGASGRGFERAGETRGQDPVVAQPFPVANTLTQRMHKGINTTVDERQTPIVAHSLRAEGFDASGDGTGRGTPPVPVAYRVHGEHSTAMTGNGVARVADPVDVSRCLDSCGGYATNQGGNIVAQPVAFDTYNQTASEIAPTLRSMGHDGSHANGGGQVAVAFHNRQDPDVSGPVTHPLGAQDNGMAVAFDLRGREGGAMPEGPHDTANIRAASGGSSRSYVAAPMMVRRLTPTECEFLQGFPPGYTAIPFRGKPAADGNRYKALGNSMACNVMAWIGSRIQQAEQ